MSKYNHSYLTGRLGRYAAVSLVMLALSACGGGKGSNTSIEAPEPDEQSVFTSAFTDFADVSNYAQKAVARLESQGLLTGVTRFNPKLPTDRIFARRLLEAGDLGTGDLDFYQAKQLISQYLVKDKSSETVSFEGFLSKKNLSDSDTISREDFAYMVAQARQINFIETGSAIHNPAIAEPGPLLGPTVFQTVVDENAPAFDGSTVSLFHRARNRLNTTFADQPVFTLQVHPEVFKSVSVGGIDVDSLQDLSAQLEVELTDGTIHRTPLTSMVPFSIHGADGKRGVIRIEDGILILVEDLLGNVDSFDLNGHAFTTKETIKRMESQQYYNGDKTDNEILEVVSNELNSKGFSLQDRRLMLHNMILAKTALQQSGLSPLAAPFNTIAGPSSSSRSFKEGHLFSTYKLAEKLRVLIESGKNDEARELLNGVEAQQNLLTGTKILTAATLLPHISSLANAPFLPNEALSSRVKKSGALLPSEPIVFQLDRLKRAAYVLLDDTLSKGNPSHLVTNGEIIKNADSPELAFTLSAGNFKGIPLKVNQSVLLDALYDYTQSYETLINLISGVNFSGSLDQLDESSQTVVSEAFSKPIMNSQMASIKIGDLDFKMDMLATPSHVRDTFVPANDLTVGRQSEAFSLEDALEPFPLRLAKYVCDGEVFTDNGEFIADSKILAEQQQDLISDISESANQDCLTAVSNSPRYKQLLFVDNFQLPSFGPSAKFISTQGIEIINRILLSPVDHNLPIADIRLSYRLDKNETKAEKAPKVK